MDAADPSSPLPRGIEYADANLVHQEIIAVIAAIETERNAFFELEIEDVEVLAPDAVVFRFPETEGHQG